MARNAKRTVVRAVTGALWRRDRLEMRAADKLLSLVERRRRPRGERSMPQMPRAGFTSILCPIDFSEHSRLALQYAEALAARAQARLVVTYANDPLLVAAAAVALHDRRLAQRSAKELRTFVDAALAGGPATRRRLKLKTHVSVGSPAEEILAEAARNKSDLIVLGTQGLTGAHRLLMGSTTLSVLQKTTVPVLAVPSTGEDLALPSASWPGARIAVALDLEGGGSATEVDAAARMARWFGSSLLLLHVVDEIDAPDWIGGDLSAHQRIRVAKAQEQVDTLTARARRSVEADGRVVCGRIAEEIAALAAREQIGLIVTALRDRRGWFGAQRGSVSYHVISHAVSPVLAFPPR